MQFLSLCFLASVASGLVIPTIQLPWIKEKDEGLSECCFTFADGNDVAVFRTTTREGFIHSTPRNWCTAAISRDENDLNNCFAATTKVFGGYCGPYGSPLTVTDCT